MLVAVLAAAGAFASLFGLLALVAFASLVAFVSLLAFFAEDFCSTFLTAFLAAGLTLFLIALDWGDFLLLLVAISSCLNKTNKIKRSLSRPFL